MKKAFLVLVVLAMSVPSWGQTESRPEILVLGTYHMANPGHDIFNVQADDVLATKRQQEIAELIGVLKKFRPTKIAVEADVGNAKTPQQYSDYLAGKHSLSRNEVEQIGYRLAKELGHKTVYPVDEDGELPIQRVTNYAKATGTSGQLDAIVAQWGVLAKAEEEFLHSHTILETLEYMNSDSRTAKDVGLYFATVRFGEPGDYAGADLLASWYQRNLRIYENIVKLIDSPNERILVIYGAGHLGWLRQCIANDPSVQLRKLAEMEGK